MDMKTNQRAPRLVLRGALTPLQQLTSQAHQQHPCFELTFLSSGRTFKALIRAKNATTAAHEGLLELATQCPEFDPENSRLVAAVETR